MAHTFDSQVLMTAIRELDARYQETLRSSDTAEALALRWHNEVQSWHVSHTVEVRSDHALGHLDVFIKHENLKFARSAIREWAQVNLEKGANIKVGGVMAQWDGEQLVARFMSHGLSTSDLQRQVRNYITYFEQAQEAINKEIDTQSANKQEIFRRWLEVKAENDKRHEEERARAAQVADLEAVIENLKLKKKS